MFVYHSQLLSQDLESLLCRLPALSRHFNPLRQRMAPTVSAVAPPVGATLNSKDPPSLMAQDIALHTICLFFVTLFLMIRVYTRRITNQRLRWDDCMAPPPLHYPEFR